MTPMDIEWEEPPGPPRRPNTNQIDADLAAALRQNPGQWARHPAVFSNSAAASHIKTGARAAYRPAGAFEARSRRAEDGQVSIWIRFVGGEQQ